MRDSAQSSYSLNHPDHHVVRHQVTSVHERPGGKSQFRSRRDLYAKQITCREVSQGLFPCKSLGLCALACAGRPKKYDEQTVCAFELSRGGTSG